jgi:hypothetical protein
MVLAAGLLVLASYWYGHNDGYAAREAGYAKLITDFNAVQNTINEKDDKLQAENRLLRDSLEKTVKAPGGDGLTAEVARQLKAIAK